MSNIVVNPSRKAENSIYLVFSAVLVTFMYYLVAGLNTGTDFVPDFLVVMAISSIIASALVYASPDEELIHWRLKKRNTSKKTLKETSEFFIFTQYLLGSYVIITRRVQPPEKEVLGAIDAVLEGNDLDTEIWKLRGAFWLLLSLLPSGLIVCSILKWASICIFIAALIISVGILVLEPSIRQYKQTANYSRDLSQFHWFDEILTATRRTETTATKTVTELNLTLDGLSEAVYRGISGTKDKRPPEIENVPEIVKPIVDERSITPADRKESSVDLTGSISDNIQVSRETRRKYNALLAEEAIWLRELVQMCRWKLFSSRFQKLKSDIVLNAKLNQNNLPSSIIDEWSKCLIFNEIFHSFSEIRRLASHMKNLGLIPDTDLVTINALLYPSEKDMKNPSISLAYYEEKISCSYEISKKIRQMFIDYADHYTEEYIKDFGPPEEDIPLDHEVGFFQSKIYRETGQSIDIFPKIDDINLNDIKEQDYAFQEDLK